jgi:hypothetical protein
LPVVPPPPLVDPPPLGEPPPPPLGDPPALLVPPPGHVAYETPPAHGVALAHCAALRSAANDCAFSALALHPAIAARPERVVRICANVLLLMSCGSQA